MTEKALGILCLDTTFDKIPGHIRNPATFDFPIVLEVVEGSTPQRVVRDGDPALLEPFVAAARALEAEGVIAVGTSCGFLVMFQREIAAALRIPFFSSSLLQLPMVHALLPPGRRVGVMVADATTFGSRHLRAIGAEHVPIAVAGMEEEPEFRETILEGRRDRLDVERLREETVRRARWLVETHPDIGALVVECTDLPPFSADIQRAVGRPVFDAITLARTMFHALTQRPYGAV